MTDEQTTSSTPRIGTEMLSAYGTMLTWLFIATVSIVVLISIPTAIAYYNHWQPYIMVYVILSGALGGFISSLSRLYSMRELPALLLHPNSICSPRSVAPRARINAMTVWPVFWSSDRRPFETTPRFLFGASSPGSPSASFPA